MESLLVLLTAPAMFIIAYQKEVILASSVLLVISLILLFFEIKSTKSSEGF